MVAVHPRAVLLVQLYYYMMAVMQRGSVGVSQLLFHWSSGTKNIGRPGPRGFRNRTVFTTPTIVKSVR